MSDTISLENAGGGKRCFVVVYDQILFLKYVSWNEGLGKYNQWGWTTLNLEVFRHNIVKNALNDIHFSSPKPRTATVLSIISLP